MKKFKYPNSFPNKEEKLFLDLILSKEEEFPKLWKEWRNNIIFDNINYSILKLISFLHLRLKSFDISDEITGKIKGIYRLTWYKNQLILNATRDLIILLEKENITVILLKGVPLLENVYKNSGARFLGDSDILIDPKYIKKVTNIMLNNGWNYLYQSDFSINRHTDPLSNKIIKEITFINDKNVEIDVHWSLFVFLFKENREHPMSYDEIYKHSLDFELKGVKYKMPCMEDMIIHIIAHGAEEINYRTLRWVLDIIIIIRNNSIDWEFLIERTKKFEVEIELNVAFSYLINNFLVSIPESFIEELSKLPIKKIKIKEYYRRTNKRENLFFGSFFNLWRRYWLYNKKGNLFISLYYFLDYICKSWGITKKRQIPRFIYEKYRNRINFWLHKK